MKRFLISAALLFCVGSAAFAGDSIARSSNTATADVVGSQVGMLCGGGRRGILYAVNLSSGGQVGAQLSVVNSSFSTIGTPFYGPISGGGTNAPSSLTFKTGFPKGLLYTSTGTATWQIIYDCY